MRDRGRLQLGLAAIAIAAFAAGCKEAKYHFADDLRIQFLADGPEGTEKVESIKAALGCEGAHKQNEDEKEKKAREAEIPKSVTGKAWLDEVCAFADAFDTAESFTAWPEGKSTWAGVRICHDQYHRVMKQVGKEPDLKDDLTDAFGHAARVELASGPGKKLWEAAPDIPADRMIPFSFLMTELNFRYTDEKVDQAKAFFAALQAGENPDVEPLRTDENKDDRATWDSVNKVFEKHNVTGILAKSDGKSVLAYPVLGIKDDSPSATHYLRQSTVDGKTVMWLLTREPSPCIAKLVEQKPAGGRRAEE